MNHGRQITHSQPPEWTGVEYSSVCPFNADNSRILLVKRDHFGLFDGDGTFLINLAVPASGEPKWSRTDNRFFYFIDANMLWMYSTWSNTKIPIHSFPEYASISGKGESDISPDGDHLVLCGDDREVFVYELSTDTKGTVFSVEPFDGLKISASNKIVLSRNSDGIYVLNSGSWPRKIVPYDAHAVVTVDTDGSEIIVWAQSDDINAITKTRLSDGKSTVLLDLGWSKPDAGNSMAVNISACDEPWVLVSTYGRDSSLKYANQILKVMKDGSGVEVLCNHNSVAAYYNAQPHAAVSRDGSRFVFSSNSGRNADPYCDVFMVQLSMIVAVSGGGTRINYAPYVGKSEFVLVPRSDGAVDIFERKL